MCGWMACATSCRAGSGERAGGTRAARPNVQAGHDHCWPLEPPRPASALQVDGQTEHRFAACVDATLSRPRSYLPPDCRRGGLAGAPAGAPRCGPSRRPSAGVGPQSEDNICQPDWVGGSPRGLSARVGEPHTIVFNPSLFCDRSAGGARGRLRTGARWEAEASAGACASRVGCQSSGAAAAAAPSVPRPIVRVMIAGAKDCEGHVSAAPHALHRPRSDASPRRPAVPSRRAQTARTASLAARSPDTCCRIVAATMSICVLSRSAPSPPHSRRLGLASGIQPHCRTVCRRRSTCGRW